MLGIGCGVFHAAKDSGVFRIAHPTLKATVPDRNLRKRVQSLAPFNAVLTGDARAILPMCTSSQTP